MKQFKRWGKFTNLRLDFLAFVIENNGKFACKHCGSNTIPNEEVLLTMHKKNGLCCSLECSWAYRKTDPEFMKRKERRRRKTNRKKYGVAYAQQTKAVSQKQAASLKDTYKKSGKLILEARKETVQKRYRADSPMQVAEVLEKRRLTCEKKYGVSSPLLLEKSIAARKAACVAAWKDPKIRKRAANRARETSLANYGANHFLQSEFAAEAIANSAGARGRLKAFFKYDQEWALQGSEPQALDFMVEELRFKPRFIVNGRGVPTISYRLGRRDRKYYPDFFVKNRKLLVEVKSPYTAYHTSERWKMLKAKATASIEAGFGFALILVLENRRLFVEWSDDLTVKQLKEWMKCT